MLGKESIMARRAAGREIFAGRLPLLGYTPTATFPRSVERSFALRQRFHAGNNVFMDI